MKKLIIAFIASIPIAVLKPMEDKAAVGLKKIKATQQEQTKNNKSSSHIRDQECFFCGHTDCDNLRRLKE